jgi:hypothetical protein
LRGKIFEHTVDGDSNALVENVAISSNKGWDLSELVDLEVVGRDTLRRLSLNDLEVNIVCLRNSADGSGAGVTLRTKLLADDCKEKLQMD